MYYTSKKLDPETAYLIEPIAQPYPGPYTIPVMMDAVKRLEGFNMSRCTFFSIEAIGNFDNWVGYLRSQEIPFIVFGVTAVLHRPDLNGILFSTAELIENLINNIEILEGLIVETEHIWLPNFLFSWVNDKDLIERELFPLERGAVWRIEYGLFRLALTFQRQVFNPSTYNNMCMNLLQQGKNIVEFSEEETIAYREWSRAQIEEAKKNYLRQREDVDRGVLDYINEEGLQMAG